MSKKKISLGFFSGSRSEFGLISEIILEAQKNNFFETKLYLSGSHFKSEFGNTLKEIQSVNLKKLSKIFLKKMNTTDPTYYADTISQITKKLSIQLKKDRPDFFIIHGDRFETFAAGITSTSMNIPTIQIEAGDITNGGTFDDTARHAISRLSHLLTTTNKESQLRLIKQGEEKWRICNIGISSLSKVNKKKYASKLEIKKKYNINFNKPIIIFTFHPISLDINKTKNHIKICTKSLIQLSKNFSVIVTYPNDDYGSKYIISEYKKLYKYKNIQVIKSLGKYYFHSLMNLNLQKKHKIFCLGNSSSGLKEAIFFNCFSINLGERQLNRIQTKNVLNIKVKKKVIVETAKRIAKKRFENKNVNPFYQKDSIKKLLNLIKKNFNNKFRLLNKKYF